MAIRESDNDEVRRKIDEQDRLDAEEIMVNSMLESASSVSSASRSSGNRKSRPPISHRLGRAYPIPNPLPISSIRRARPPSLPPRPTFPMKDVSPERKWKKPRSIVIAVFGLALSGILVFAGAIGKGYLELPRIFNTSASRVGLIIKPFSLRSMMSEKQKKDHTYNGTNIPTIFESNAIDFHDRNHSSEIPLLWRIPFSGDEAWTEIMGICMGFTQAADDLELIATFMSDLELMSVETPKGRFLNIDLTDNSGIHQAKSINLASLGELDSITSSNLQVLTLFDDLERKARAFTTFRNPAKRALTFFYGSRDTSSRYFDPSLENATLGQYATWPYDRVEFNFMVKSLVSSGNELIATDEIDAHDLELAKRILDEKFLILLIDDMIGSWTKLDYYMGWSHLAQDRRICEDSILKLDWPQTSQQLTPLGSNEAAYAQLIERNRWDMALYEHALLLFQKQTAVLVQ